MPKSSLFERIGSIPIYSNNCDIAYPFIQRQEDLDLPFIVFGIENDKIKPLFKIPDKYNFRDLDYVRESFGVIIGSAFIGEKKYVVMFSKAGDVIFEQEWEKGNLNDYRIISQDLVFYKGEIRKFPSFEWLMSIGKDKQIQFVKSWRMNRQKYALYVRNFEKGGPTRDIIIFDSQKRQIEHRIRLPEIRIGYFAEYSFKNIFFYFYEEKEEYVFEIFNDKLQKVKTIRTYFQYDETMDYSRHQPVYDFEKNLIYVFGKTGEPVEIINYETGQRTRKIFPEFRSEWIYKYRKKSQVLFLDENERDFHMLDVDTGHYEKFRCNRRISSYKELDGGFYCWTTKPADENIKKIGEKTVYKFVGER